MSLSTDMNVKQVMQESEQLVEPAFARIREIARENQRKVLKAFWDERVSESDLHGSTGYGLGDEGRDKLDRIYANVFGAEAGLVRSQIVSGTHALRLGLFAAVKPGDKIVFATGSPYDTLESVIGIRETAGSLAYWGVKHRIVPLVENGQVDIASVLREVQDPQVRMVFFQRSRGYSDRSAISCVELAKSFSSVRQVRSDIVIAVDNCYGEFTETVEPTDVGADLVMGSLIKNPGGGLASTGGYVVGRSDLVELAAGQLTAPGIGSEAGPSHDFLRLMYQGLFLAPHMVSQALLGSVLAAAVFSTLGCDVSPMWSEPRTDLILSIRFGNPEALLAFCQVVQSSAPVDSFVKPYGAPMAGYESDVVMAAGAFVQGGSLELSADGPMRAPYIGYFQGGLTYEHAYIAVERIAARLIHGAAAH